MAHISTLNTNPHAEGSLELILLTLGLLVVILMTFDCPHSIRKDILA